MALTLIEPKVDVEIRPAKEFLVPGESIQVEVVVSPQEQLNVHELRLELVGIESYRIGFNFQMLRGEGQLVNTINEFTRVPYTVLEQSTLHCGLEVRRKIQVQIPIDAPPSCRGTEVKVYWKLRMVLDVPRHFSKVWEVPVQVISSPTSGREVMTDLTVEKSYKDCNLVLEVPRKMTAEGKISGHLQVKVLGKFQARGIRVELRQIEDAEEIKVNDAVAHQELSGPVSFNDTDSPSFAFSLPLPSDAPPTMKTPHSSLRWQVRAILNLRLHTDLHIERDVFIYNAPA